MLPGPLRGSRREVRGGLGLRRPVTKVMGALLHMVRIDGEILWCSARLQLGNHHSASGAHCAVGEHRGGSHDAHPGPGWKHCTATAKSGHIVGNVHGNAADHIDLDEIEARQFRGRMGQHGLCRTRVLTVVQMSRGSPPNLGQGCADRHDGCGNVRLTSEPSL